VLTVPGLIIMLIVAAQAAGGFAWLPVVRRALAGIGVGRSRAAVQTRRSA
jgi:hypothetical protein